ncbi:MAG: hypothetical protein M1824_002007 [Vezdaea acicularis]|nr:MAG: hypothetical protein M1824_002007 [Vezdaea acicularis]
MVASRIQQLSFDTQSTEAHFISSPKASFPPQKKQKMSISATWALAHTARAKLTREAGRADHRLHRLVGHANLLDELMIDLANAERESENWFNQSVKAAAPKAAEEPRHIQWANTIPEEDEDFDAESDDSSDDDDEDEDVDMDASIALRRVPSPSTTVSAELDSESEDEYADDDEENYGDLALVRTPSHSPPELLHDSDSEDDDVSPPPSPPQVELEYTYTEKERQSIATSSYYEQQKSDSQARLSPVEQQSFFDEGFYLPQRDASTMVDAY